MKAQGLKVSASVLASAVALGLSFSAHGGAYMFAGEANGLEIITHPSGYSGSGGALAVKVCIDANAADANDLVIPVLNTIKVFNSLQEASPNLFFGGNNNIPSGAIDFQSLVSHEIGHCVGLAHPNQGTQGGTLSGDDTNATNSGDGGDDTYDFDFGSDGIPGSADDIRGDDQNLHWFVTDVNNPFASVANPTAATYTRDLANLPNADNFPVNAGRDVGPSLGFSDTEAVMQQGQFTDEDQRQLQADDVATLRMAMTGLDRTAGTSDDYTFRLVYGGKSPDGNDCDLMIESENSGFGACAIGGQFISANHLKITNATFTYNATLNWFFNQVQNTQCTVGSNNVTVSGGTESGEAVLEACDSVSLENGHRIASSGNVVVVSPRVTLAPGTRVDGRLKTIAAVP